MQDNDRLTIHNVRDQIVGVDAQVPLLDGSHRQYIYFDNAASTPALQPVSDKVNEFMTSTVWRRKPMPLGHASWSMQLNWPLIALSTCVLTTIQPTSILWSYRRTRCTPPMVQGRLLGRPRSLRKAPPIW